MTSHRSIINNAATAVYNSADIRDFCIANFGRGLAVHVGAYAAAIPDEKDSPFLWIVPVEENEAIKEDDLFSVRFVVGGCVRGPGGEKVIENVVAERTATTNGLTLNGGNAVIEDLRDICMYVVRNAGAGAIPNRIRREEADIEHFPLSWAVFYVEYLEPVSLVSALSEPPSAPTPETAEEVAAE